VDDRKKHTIVSYVALWQEATTTQSLKLLDELVCRNVKYQDPFSGKLEGIAKLKDCMVSVLRSFPASTHELSGELHLDDSTATYDWVARLQDGRKIQGTDIVFFDNEDKICSIRTVTNKSDWL
jgi:hypothetical protein